MKKDPKYLKIQFFGRFRLYVCDKEMNFFTARSGQLMTLLEYLLVHHDTVASQEELYEVLWPEETGDPAGALKNLVYRLRTAFAQKDWKEGRELILCTGNGYACHPDFTYDTDIEEFEKLLKKAKQPHLSAEKRCALYEKAFSLYHGDFLADQSAELWLLSLNRYYHSLYFENLYTYLDLLLERKDYLALQMAAMNAVKIDQFDEKAHQYLLRALILQKRTADAMNYYHQMQTLFYHELGVNLTEETEDLYREVFRTVNRVELDFDRIKQDVQEMGEVQGAYFCDYTVFKSIYRLEARAAIRSKMPCCIALLTLNYPHEELTNHQFVQVMELLQEELLDLLRKGDIVAQFSAMQYIVLLQDIREEEAKKVLQRVETQFSQMENCGFTLLTDLRNMDILD